MGFSLEVVYMRGVDPDSTVGILNTEKVSRELDHVWNYVEFRCEKIRFLYCVQKFIFL